MDNFEYGVSNKGSQTILYKEFVYVRNRGTINGTVHWRCAKFRALHCRSTIHIKNNKVICEPSDHCHTNSKLEVEIHKLTKKMKNEIMAQPGLTAVSVINTNMLTISDELKKALPKKSTMARRLNDFKARALANLSETEPFEDQVTIKKKVVETKSNTKLNMYSKWIIHDSGENDPERVILIGHKSLFKLLVDNDCWLADGTYKIIPGVCYQLYSIHVQDESGAAYPCILALLPKREERIFVKMLNMLVEKLPEARPRKIFTDFETASMNAFRKVFENINGGGYVFHLSQSILQKLTECGLMGLYEANESFSINVKMLLALSLIPEEEVLDAFLEVGDMFCDFHEYEEQIDQFVVLFESKYVRGRQLRNCMYKAPVFSVSIWNNRQSAGSSIARTKECVDGWHYELQSRIESSDSSEPNICKFFDNIVEELCFQHTSFLRQRKSNRAKYVSLKERISKIVQSYDSNKRLEFMRCIAHMV